MWMGRVKVFEAKWAARNSWRRGVVVRARGWRRRLLRERAGRVGSSRSVLKGELFALVGVWGVAFGLRKVMVLVLVLVGEAATTNACLLLMLLSLRMKETVSARAVSRA